jgi:hypothetical protein
MVELASWDVPAEELVDRTDRSWDNPSRTRFPKVQLPGGPY